MHIPTGSTVFVYGKITLMIHSIFILGYKIIYISNVLKGVLSPIIHSPLYMPLMYVYYVYILWYWVCWDWTSSIAYLLLYFPSFIKKYKHVYELADALENIILFRFYNRTRFNSKITRHSLLWLIFIRALLLCTYTILPCERVSDWDDKYRCTVWFSLTCIPLYQSTIILTRRMYSVL